jgi:hypothetical protein
MTTSLLSATPHSTTVILADCSDLANIEHQAGTHRLGVHLESCGQLVGVAVFQSEVQLIIEEWFEKWKDAIETMSSMEWRMKDLWAKCIRKVNSDINNPARDSKETLGSFEPARVSGVESVDKNWSEIKRTQEEYAAQLLDMLSKLA